MELSPILADKLSLNSDIPLYTQLVGIIKRHISSGALAVGVLLVFSVVRMITLYKNEKRTQNS